MLHDQLGLFNRVHFSYLFLIRTCYATDLDRILLLVDLEALLLPFFLSEELVFTDLFLRIGAVIDVKVVFDDIIEHVGVRRDANFRVDRILRVDT